MEASSADPAADRLSGMDGDNTAADRMELAAKKAAQIAAAMKLSPKVQARLESVLGNMDPLFIWMQVKGHILFCGIVPLLIQVDDVVHFNKLWFRMQCTWI